MHALAREKQYDIPTVNRWLVKLLAFISSALTFFNNSLISMVANSSWFMDHSLWV
jgi:hypothetical protein